MAVSILQLLVTLSVICVVSGFSVKPATFRQKAVVSKTLLFEVNTNMMTNTSSDFIDDRVTAI